MSSISRKKLKSLYKCFDKNEVTDANRIEQVTDANRITANCISSIPNAKKVKNDRMVFLGNNLNFAQIKKDTENLSHHNKLQL